MNQTNQFNEGLEYAQMLEIPVSTVNVVKKKSLFARKGKGQDDLKSSAIESVNSRLEGTMEGGENGSFTYAEDLSTPAYPAKKKDRLGAVIICEAVLACLIATGIFLCNFFLPNTAINTFVGKLSAVETKETPYNEFTLTSPVSETSEATVAATADGVLHFTEKTSVYPLCDGQVASITQNGGTYTVKIEHTSSFCSVVTGLNTVYSGVGEEVKGNLPFAYSNGENEVKISMYDGETLLNCYTLTGAVPVWNS
ncbi:MAG: hypothetical protein ACI4MB_03355 [Candidatus Coproplasma sp.]